MDDQETADSTENNSRPTQRTAAAFPLNQADLLRLIEAARKQFAADLPDLLDDNSGRWVVYRGDQQLSIDYSEFEAEKSEAAMKFPLEEVRAFWIMAGEDEQDTEAAA